MDLHRTLFGKVGRKDVIIATFSQIGMRSNSQKAANIHEEECLFEEIKRE